MLSMEVALSHMHLPAGVIWQIALDSHPELERLEGHVDLDGRSCPASAVRRHLSRRGKGDFTVTWNGASEISYAHVIPVFQLSLVIVKECIRDDEDAVTWVTGFAVLPQFIQARVYDEDYDYWQNAEEIYAYERAGRDYRHLPQRSNGLPPPLQSMVIDTSRNPGRRILRHGYVEAVSARMWLGTPFWQATGASKADLSGCPWLQVEGHGSYVAIQASPAPFVNAEGLAGCRQEDLRRRLFPSVQMPGRP